MIKNLYRFVIAQVRHFIIVGTVLSLWVWNGCETKRESPFSFHVYSVIDTSSATIGDVLHCQVWAKGAGKRIIEFPGFVVDNPDISLGEKRTLESDYSDNYGMEFEITFWDTGSFTLPAYPVNVMSITGDSVEYAIFTDPIGVTVHTVIKDSQPELRDIKPPVPLPMILPLRLIISLMLIFILMGVLLWLWRKRIPARRKEKREIYIPSKPPYEIAVEKLKKLHEVNVSTPSQIKVFYTELSYIIREFLEYQYFVRAIEMTTEEIFHSKSYLPLNGSLMDRLLSVLKRADLAKFARFQPDRNQCLSDLKSMEDLVIRCRLEWFPAETKAYRMEAV